MTDFVIDTLEPLYYARYKLKVEYNKQLSKWRIENRSLRRNTLEDREAYDTNRMDAYNIIENTLNMGDKGLGNITMIENTVS